MQKTHTFLIALLIVAMSTIVIVAVVVLGKSKEKDQFTISGTGTVYAKADIANITIGIKSETKKTALEATRENVTKMNSIIGELQKLGINENDVKTSEYKLNPVYNWTQDDGQKLIGYEVIQNVTLKVRNLDIIGSVIAKTTEQGANQIGEITFTIDDETILKNQAREIAIKKAKEKAALIAAQTGMKLGSIKNVTENFEPAYRTFAKTEMSAAADAKEALPMPEIKPGQNEIKVDVALTYEVR